MLLDWACQYHGVRIRRCECFCYPMINTWRDCFQERFPKSKIDHICCRRTCRFCHQNNPDSDPETSIPGRLSEVTFFQFFLKLILVWRKYTLKLCKHVFSKFEISARLLLSVCELLQAGANDPFSSCSKLQNTTGTRLGYFLWLLRLIKTGAKDIYLFTWRPWSKSRSCMECAATLVQDREKRRNRYSTPPPKS